MPRPAPPCANHFDLQARLFATHRGTVFMPRAAGLMEPPLQKHAKGAKDEELANV